MKKIIFACIIAASAWNVNAQLAPQASPLSTVNQKVGLTDLTVVYSRPSKNDRDIFGGLIPFGEVWRTGANENTKFTTSDLLIFGKDTLKAGTYALYTIPNKDAWEVIFYSDYSNWGTPDKWDESKVVLKQKVAVETSKSVQQTFSIGFDNFKTDQAELVLAWDKTTVRVPFKLTTDTKVMANIKKVMGGPTANDYYQSANYYYNNKKDLKQALEWAQKAVSMRSDAYWFQAVLAKIQSDLGMKAEALQTAKVGRELAVKAENNDYVVQFDELIAKNSK